jgi:predicted Fe-Mo cluster-binding NifX family protein
MTNLESSNEKELEEVKRKKLQEMLHRIKSEGDERLGVRIVIPTADESGLNSQLAEHFGRAPYFAVVDLDEKGEVSSVRTSQNTGEHAGGMGQAHDNVFELRPNAIIVYGMGPRGIQGFQDRGVAVLKATASTVRGVIAAYKEGRLQELTEGCHEAHHK